MRIDLEQDFHHYTVVEMVSWLNREWASRRWDGLQRVRIIHGKGEVLPPALRRWCDEKGIPWAPESGNPGTTILHPARRSKEKTALLHRPLSGPLTSLKIDDAARRATAKQPDKQVQAGIGRVEAADLFLEEIKRLDKRERRSGK
jgi:hypothetical protein